MIYVEHDLTRTGMNTWIVALALLEDIMKIKCGKWVGHLALKLDGRWTTEITE